MPNPQAENTGGSDLRVTFINWNGFIDEETIASGNTTQVDCVGDISTFSNPFYTLTEL